MQVKVIHGFTDNKTNKNYQDNDIIDISDTRYEELKDKFVEKYIEPVKEVDNSELLEKIKKLEKENADYSETIKKLVKENSEKENSKLEKELKKQSKSGEDNGKVQK